MKLSHKLIFGLTVFYPVFAFAASGNFRELVGRITSILGRLIPILIGFAVVVFFWGIIQYVTAGADQKRLETGKKILVYGVIGIFVAVSFWGLVLILKTTFFG